MVYVVQSSERVRCTGAEYETKAMLYLMNCREDSDQIDFFAIDFYNDVTGLSTHADKAWDVQSKGTKTNNAKAIGKELVTLFKNEMSVLQFDYLVLFVAGVPKSFRRDDSKNIFTVDNIRDKALKSVRQGLIAEAQKKVYIEKKCITAGNIDSFLRRVTFVVDVQSKADYIRGIIKVNPKYIPQDNVLEGIFNKIRDVQAGKKNNDSVEGEVVSHLRDVLLYDRVLKSKEIRLMVLNSLVNHDVIHTPAPDSFYQLLHRYDGIRQKDVIEDCKLQISTLLCDKTCADEFWSLLELIFQAVEENKTLSIEQTFALIEDKKPVKNPRLNMMAVQYMISVIKEALH